MQIVQAVEEVRSVRWADPIATWGLVPTMGALHEGHLSLAKRARAENDYVGVSIFVNPTQFNARGDLDAYPRTLARDCELLASEGVDLVWAPTDDIAYPPGYQTYVTVEEVTRPLEGAARPGHFRGVTTIVTKLFNVFQPTRVYFGQKDAQQVVVVRRMVADLDFNLEIVVCPTVRESDGLAMSSRNTRLNAEERTAATVLYRALMAAHEAWQHGERNGEKLREIMCRVLQTEPLAHTDYVSVAQPETLEEMAGDVEGNALFSMAVYIGQVRLIDNILVPHKEP